MSFENLNLDPKILRAIAKAGYETPTEIQQKVIPKIQEGFDIRGSAQTGTGKTAAFLLPALNRIIKTPAKKNKGPRILILVPTRELAMQITTQADKYSKYLNRINIACVFGGVPYHQQSRALCKPVDILVATPGRLIDFIDQKKIDLSNIEMFILDEADRMLDMGFIEPVEEIAGKMPETRQTLMFSATLQGSVLNFSKRLLKDPLEVVIHAKKEKNSNITQTLHYTDGLHHKNKILNHILSQKGVDVAIIFTATKRHADTLVLDLKDQGIRASALHGDMNQRQRTRTISMLRSGRINILAATDVAARGIDVQSITHVINFDLPQCTEDYVHRIGRTARAGKTGTAISFASNKDAYLVRQIEEFTGHKIDVKEIEGLEPTKKLSSNRGPARKRGSSSRGPGRRPSGRSVERSGTYRSEGRSGKKPSNSSRFGRTASSDDKPSRGRSERSSYSDDKPSRKSRTGRNSSNDERSSYSYRSDGKSSKKPSNGGRFGRTSSSDERPSRGRSERSSYSDAKPSGNKRFGSSSSGRPSRGNSSSSNRPSFGNNDRPNRSSRAR
jgi:superfamily II DNA/RNA helicase